MAEGQPTTQYQASSNENPTQDIIPTLRAFEPPPKDFDPLKEKNSVLVKHGCPARPGPNTPLRLAAWDRVFSRVPSFITPTFSPLPSVPRPPLPDIPLLTSIAYDPALCGVLLPVPASGAETEYIYGAWTIPKAYPPKSAHTATGLTNGTWSFKIWMEIDGVYTKRIGTTQQVTVSGGRITSQTAYVWVGSRSGGTTVSEAQITSLSVGPGDVMAFAICQTQTGTPDGGLVTAHNIGDSTFTSTQMFATANSPFIGTVARWMVELPPAATYEDSVQFGSVIMWGCAAGYGNEHQMQLSDSLLINTKRGDKIVSSVSLKENDMVVISGQ
ncbi:MAG: hypothetical protein M1839_003532 [Geoglossum umbratile]|nr:MAG: hypothetical protein M1839_003532 [Geoglossum umbratile]